jgi:F-type H+-transporting ATPase subunit gamma
MGMQQLRIDLANTFVYRDLTDVMKSIASVKFPKARKRLDGFRVFGDAVRENLLLAFNSINPDDVTAENFKREIDALNGASAHLEIEEGLKKFGLEPFFKHTDSHNTLVIIISANQGFCGKFNREVNTNAQEIIEELSRKSKVKTVCIGKKAGDHFNLIKQLPRESMLVFPDKNEEEKVQLSNHILKNIILDPFLKKEISDVKIIYNSFSESPKIEVRTSVVSLLPIPRIESKKKDQMDRKVVFEPSPLICLSYLIREYLFSLMMRFFIESETAEQYLRMNSMNQASDAIKESIEKQESNIRKMRQTVITKELVEIISGAEALKNRDN